MLNNFALTGFSLLSIFTFFKLFDTINNPYDFIANIILLISLVSFAIYYFYKINYKKYKNKKIKNIKIFAHLAISVFIVMTLSPYSFAIYRFYDNFALLGNLYLAYSTSYNKSDALGLGSLAVYFVCATYNKINKGNLELFKLFGNLILSIYFIISFVQNFGILKAIK